MHAHAVDEDEPRPGAGNLGMDREKLVAGAALQKDRLARDDARNDLVCPLLFPGVVWLRVGG